MSVPDPAIIKIQTWEHDHAYKFFWIYEYISHKYMH